MELANRDFDEYQEKSQKIGANFFLPKLMTKMHLLKLIQISIRAVRSIEYNEVKLFNI